MQLNSLKLLYFSPTGTTRTIVEEIAGGIESQHIETIDCTCPAVRAATPPVIGEDVVILGAPVYSGRLPSEAARYFETLRAEGTPAILVVVYGNRAYDDALRELFDLSRNAGFLPIASAAFIGEHSFSSKEIPLAPSRPDADDKTLARDFGEKIRTKLHRIDQIDDLSALHVPGNFPYRKRSAGLAIAPTTLKTRCTRCGRCADVCPTGAISHEHLTETDPNACILCCACVKTCPTKARVMDHEVFTGLQQKLHGLCSERKEPEMYL